jgi:hypothetical protein
MALPDLPLPWCLISTGGLTTTAGHHVHGRGLVSRWPCLPAACRVSSQLATLPRFSR